MLSIEYLAAVRVAVEVSHHPYIKMEIFCLAGSVNGVKKSLYRTIKERDWNRTIKRKALEILKILGLPYHLQERIAGLVLLVALRMFIWAEYHESSLGLSLEYSMTFLKSHLFTQWGIIDNKRAAEVLMDDNNLSVWQKYRLACLYCFTEHIPVLFRHIKNEDMRRFYSSYSPGAVNQPKIVKLWTYSLMGEVDKLIGDEDVDQYTFQAAVKSGSKEAVQYCMRKTNVISKKNDAIVDAAEKAFVKIAKSQDWVVFLDSYRKSSWVPSDYYMDILCFLLSIMTNDQKIEFLKINIENCKTVVDYFLDWPYQDYFMKTVQLMWNFLPEEKYTLLILKICDKFQSVVYDYRSLLKEFWIQSPERFKRYVFSNQEIDFYTFREGTTLSRLLRKFFTSKNFTCEDEKIIEMISASMCEREKENLSFGERYKICFELLKKEEWGKLNMFSNWFLSRRQVDEFKRNLLFRNSSQKLIINFVKNENPNAGEAFMKWCALPVEEKSNFLKSVINSFDGRETCLNLIEYTESVENFDRFITWWFPAAADEANEFRKELIFSNAGLFTCNRLVIQDQLRLVTGFINLCLSSEEEVRELKKKLAYKLGIYSCEKMISDHSEVDVYDKKGYYVIGTALRFAGGKWLEVEKFLTWCFSSEVEISEFKKYLLQERSNYIHLDLVKTNQWSEAETFFAWLGLSVEEIKQLKRDHLFEYRDVWDFFFILMHCRNGDKEVVDFGGKEEAFELLLRWYLTDKETTLRFKGELNRNFTENERAKFKEGFQNLDLALERHLKDLDESMFSFK